MRLRAWHVLAAFGACITVLLLGAAGISSVAIGLDRRQLEAQRQSAVEENVRLALWRMDSALAPIVAQESARPYFVYAPFYAASRSYGAMLAPALPGETMTPSGLLEQVPEHVLVHFQISPSGEVSSPQVPEGRMLQLAKKRNLALPGLDLAKDRLAQLSHKVRPDALAEAVKREEQAELTLTYDAPKEELKTAGTKSGVKPKKAPSKIAEVEKAYNPVYAQNAEENVAVQSAKNAAEWEYRASTVQRAKSYVEPSLRGLSNRGQEQQLVRHEEPRDPPPPDASADPRDKAPESLVEKMRAIPNHAVNEGVMVPVWVGDALVLVRRVKIGGEEYLQGAWLDWPEIRQWLLTDVGDLIPGSDLAAADGPATLASERMLASLPVRLIPGPLPPLPSGVSEAVKIVLAVAWTGVLLACAAVVVLLLGMLALMERRGDFVSAVTHELRTPLTTFRMYTEMLADGMVRDEEKQKSYLETLRRESLRLSHLVENVLAYARIERGRHAARADPVPVKDLLDRSKSRLADRAGHGGMVLSIDPGAEADARLVRADPGAVDQILFNLVDNACKYAASATDRTIRVTSAAGPSGTLEIRVEDRGPGISKKDAKRLFRPFSKSSERAANSAPGVGLGLALSRRLAKAMGGDLRLVHGEGACFVLRLRTLS